jgi:hypothetical protein
MIIVLLRNRARQVVAEAVLDDEDEPLSMFRWCLNRRDRGYAVRSVSTPIGNRLLMMHRAILGLPFDSPLQGDHINHDRLDNRRSNLRIVDVKGQQQNKSNYQNCKSRFRGVTRVSKNGKFQAKATVDGVQHYLGHFTSEVQAAIAAERFRQTHMPFAEPDPELLVLLGPRLI